MSSFRFLTAGPSFTTSSEGAVAGWERSSLLACMLYVYLAISSNRGPYWGVKPICAKKCRLVSNLLQLGLSGESRTDRVVNSLPERGVGGESLVDKRIAHVDCRERHVKNRTRQAAKQNGPFVRYLKEGWCGWKAVRVIDLISFSFPLGPGVPTMRSSTPSAIHSSQWRGHVSASIYPNAE